MDMDVMLSLVNGVNGHKHKTEFDNGVLQVSLRRARVGQDGCPVGGWCMRSFSIPRNCKCSSGYVLLESSILDVPMSSNIA